MRKQKTRLRSAFSGNGIAVEFCAGFAAAHYTKHNMKDTTEASLSEVLDKLHGPPITTKRWIKFVEELDPFVLSSDITCHGALAFFWLLTSDYRKTHECKARVAELCKGVILKDVANVLDLRESSQ